MSKLGQYITVFEDDTFDLNFQVDVIAPSSNYSLAATDQVWFGIATAPGNSYILQKANSGWDKGLYPGTYYTFTNAATFNAGLPQDDSTWFEQYFFQVPTTGESTVTGGGQGANFQVRIGSDGSNIILLTGYPLVDVNNVNVTNGIGYTDDSVITIFASNFVNGNGNAATNDLVITLGPGTNATPFPPTTGDIEIEGTLENPSVKVSFNQDDFAASSGPLSTDTEYYWELVASKFRGGVAFVPTSTVEPHHTQVMATGYMYVSSSMFSVAGYRP